ncbi:hypothetical protein J4410_05360 [Candidatus Woesearchaeota archaeon]|nr:hypothetical protein [Candidatus Woesearchaeota archaeon]
MKKVQSQVMEKDQVCILLFEARNYNLAMIDVVKQLQNKKICYVSLNKTYGVLMRDFKKNGIESENIFVVDTKTGEIEPSEKSKSSSVCYVSSPAALTELSIVISYILKQDHFDYLIFDSLSTLWLYDKETYNGVAKFIIYMMNKIKSSNIRALFTVIKSENHSFLVEEASSCADLTIEYKNGIMHLLR